MPPITPPRRQQKEERREQILDAALRVFSSKGFSGASIREIARDVGVTEGLLYHYFESKDQLLEACWKERTWRAHLERILSEADGKPLEAVLRELVDDFLQTLRSQADVVRVCAREMQSNPEVAEFHRSKIADNQELLTSFLRERQARGEIAPDADLETPAGLLMGCAYSTFLLWGDQADEVWSQCANALVESGVRTVMFGIAPRPPL
jgi:AcrR family transcriptional regulator